MRQRLLSKINNWLIYIFLSLILAGVFVGSYILLNYLKKQEIKNINLVSKAIRIQQEVTAPDSEVMQLLPDINDNNQNIPLILLDEKGNVLETRNLPKQINNDDVSVKKAARKMAQRYKPIEIQLPGNVKQYVYYDNSSLLNNLQYLPIYLGIIILGYILFTYWFITTTKKTDEGFVWAGLAKETAHQIGTPLSSMIGWIEILRMENPESDGVNEIEKDISRLKTITERFSKIGSVPELNDMNLSETLQQNFDYLKSRISTKIDFKLKMPPQEFLIPHNRILMSWVIENLVKNAVDAMKGVGKLEIFLYEKNNNVIIDFADTGSGMTRQQARKVFRPGFSTKKRGWGLGLSLAKRVISEYHRGELKIAQTEPGKGTTFRIVLKNLK